MSGGTTSGFSSKVVGWLAGIATASFLLTFLIAAFGPELGGTTSAGANSYSTSAVGHLAWMETMQALGIEVIRQRSLPGSPDWQAYPLLALEPPAGRISVEQLDGLYDRRPELEDGALVLALPKWSTLPRPDKSQWIASAEPSLGDTALELINDFLLSWELESFDLTTDSSSRAQSCRGAWGGNYMVDLESMQTFDLPASYEALVECPDGVLVARTQSEVLRPPIVLISDPDLFSTHGLGDADHAALGHDLFARGLETRSIVVDEILHGFGMNRSLTRELFRFPVVLVTIHGFLVAMLLVWSGLRRFGSPTTPEPAVESGRDVLVDNAARLLDLGRHDGDALRGYWQNSLREMGRRLLRVTDLPLPTLRQRLQRHTRSRGIDVDLEALQREVDGIRPSRRKDADQVVRVAQSIHAWRQEMIDGHQRNR